MDLVIALILINIFKLKINLVSSVTLLVKHVMAHLLLTVYLVIIRPILIWITESVRAMQLINILIQPIKLASYVTCHVKHVLVLPTITVHLV